MKRNASIGLFAWLPYEKNNRIMVIHNDMGSQYAADSIVEYMGYKGYDISYISFSCIPGKNASTQCYDYILAVDCLEYVDDVEEFWTTLSGLLAKNGRIVICCENRLGLKTFCGQDLFSIDLPREHVRGRYVRTLAEIKTGIEAAKLNVTDVFAPLPDIEKTQIVLKYGYKPNESIADRLDQSDAYSFKALINRFSIMQELMDNDLFYPMADWYILVLSMDTEESLDINQVSVSADRSESDSFMTVVSCEQVIKQALYDSGVDRFRLIKDNLGYLRDRAVRTVSVNLIADSVVMPYIECETAVVVLRRLLETDTEKFLYMMDKYRDLVFESSEVSNKPMVFYEDEYKSIAEMNKIYERDLDFSDLGRILKKGLLDLVPVNLLCDGEEYIAYDQEYSKEDYPANAILYRGICCVFAGNRESHRLYDFDELLERYDLKKNQTIWVWYGEQFLRGINIEMNVEKTDYLRTIFMEKKRKLLGVMDPPYVDKENRLLDMTGLSSRILVWGTGKFAEDFFAKLPRGVKIVNAIDSDTNKLHTMWHGIEVLSFEEAISGIKDSEIVVCVKNYGDIVLQLINQNIFSFKIYDPDCCLKERAK